MEKVAIYTGFFDPFHNGHEAIVNYLTNFFDKIYLIPDQVNKHKKDQTDFETRHKMLRLLYPVDGQIIIPDSYFFAPNSHKTVVMGSDNFLRFVQNKKIMSRFPTFNQWLIVVRDPDIDQNFISEYDNRPVVTLRNLKNQDLSSTYIRKQIYADKYDNLPINNKILNFIRKNHLYDLKHRIPKILTDSLLYDLDDVTNSIRECSGLSGAKTYIVNESTVMKIYLDLEHKETASREEQGYITVKNLNIINTPYMIGVEHFNDFSILYTEYLNCSTILEYMRESEIDMAHYSIVDIALQLSKLHKEYMKEDGTTLLRGDCTLANWVLCENKETYAIDLDKVQYGYPEKEYVQFMASFTFYQKLYPEINDEDIKSCIEIFKENYSCPLNERRIKLYENYYYSLAAS